MSSSAPQTATRSSAGFLRGMAFLALLVACFEFFVAVHFHRQKLQADALAQKDLAERFQAAYYDSGIWKDTRWLGIPSEQAPTDNWSMQDIISEVRPDYIVETGTFHGGTTLYYALVLSTLNPNGRVITIDVEPHIADASQSPIWKQHVEMIVGSSVDPAVTAHIAQEVRGKKVLVTLDSLHTRDHVLKEMEIYSNLVSPGSYMVVQDTNINGHPVLPGWGPGPNEAVQEFFKTHNNFVVDRSREKYLLTFYPGGWLKRIK